MSEIICGLFAASSTIMTEALRVPDAEGLKVTVTWHAADGASALPQLCIKLKSPLLAPPITMVVRCTG